MNKGERLLIFLQRLERAPACGSADEARALLDATLNQVEDEFTSVAFNPRMWRTDGRLYPPQADQASIVKGHPQITRFRSIKHMTWIGNNGAIRITERTGKCILEKPGADGRTISESMR
jgi:hypothetical protein